LACISLISLWREREVEDDEEKKENMAGTAAWLWFAGIANAEPSVSRNG
jgi:hypothetical protein